MGREHRPRRRVHVRKVYRRLRQLVPRQLRSPRWSSSRAFFPPFLRSFITSLTPSKLLHSCFSKVTLPLNYLNGSNICLDLQAANRKAAIVGTPRVSSAFTVLSLPSLGVVVTLFGAMVGLATL